MYTVELFLFTFQTLKADWLRRCYPNTGPGRPSPDELPGPPAFIHRSVALRTA